MHPRRRSALESIRNRVLALAAALACVIAPIASAADGIPACVSPFDQFSPVSVPDGAGGMYVGWLDQRLGYNTDVYLQRITPSLQRATGWPDNGAPMTFVTCTKTEASLISDSLGVLGVWSDNRCNAGTGFDIYVERFTPSGARGAGWPANGRLVSNAPADQLHAAIAGDGAGGAFVAWTDLGVSPRRLNAHHVLANGTLDPAWPTNGLALSSTLSDSSGASLLADGAGGVFVAWQDVRTGTGDIWMQRLKSDGTPAAGWSAGGAAYITATGNQYAPRLVSDGAGGAIAVWCDRRTGVTQLRALRVGAAGATAAGWAVDGNLVAGTSGEQGRFAALGDSAGGLFVTWQDARSGTAAVHAQHLGADGAAISPWPAAGVGVAPHAGAQTAPALATDGAGGLFVSWHDARDLGTTGADVYATRLDANGTIAGGWAASGTAVCTAAAEQRDARLASNGAGGAFVTWTDARASATRGTDIAMAVLGPAGPSATAVHALTATQHDGQTFLTWSSPPGTNWKYRVYRSASPIASSADLAAATLVGTVGDSSAYDRHLSQGMNVAYGYKIDSLATSLDPAQGLFVYTASANGGAWYAVTAQNSVFGENNAVVPGVNALTAPVTELLQLPRPVYQHGIEQYGHPAEVWTLFVPDHDTPLMPAMGNRPGLAYDCAVVTPPAIPFSQTTLLVPLHYRGGSLLDGIYGTGYPGEWVLGLDDWLPNGQNTFWYGYADTYDITSTATPALTSGTVMDYTLRRVDFTLDWVLRTFPIDSTRVFAFGYSMGGAGAVLMGTHLGDRFAATMSVVGKSDYSFDADPDTTAWFNPNGSLRKLANAMWGTLATNLPASEGGHIYEQLDAGWLAEHAPERPFAPMYLYSGKLDITMGWAENAPFWDSMQAAGRGSAFYWEMRHHNENFQALWAPTQDPRRMYRYQLDQSYPAPSHCSFDQDPGNGVATDGDSTGTLNGYFEWDPLGVDSTSHWVRGVNLRTLTTMSGLRVPPDSCTMDLTIRRARHFLPLPWEPVEYTVIDIAGGGRVAQHGVAVADPSGVLTLPQVKVFRYGSLLDLQRHDVTGVPPGATAPHAGIALSRHPARGVVQMSVTWPGAGAARAALYDVSGRQVRLLWSGVAKAGTQALSLDTATLPPGLYLVGAEAGGRRVSKRMVVLR
jgi:hypothetical protein